MATTSPAKSAPAAALSVPCSCVPPTPAAQHRIPCRLCKKSYHAACALGLRTAEGERAFRESGDDYVCFRCHAAADGGKVRVVPPGYSFGCCAAELDAGVACWPCVGAGCRGRVWFHAACLGVTDGDAVAALSLRDAKYYCSGEECAPPALPVIAPAATTAAKKRRR